MSNERLRINLFTFLSNFTNSHRQGILTKVNKDNEMKCLKTYCCHISELGKKLIDKGFQV